MKNMIMAFVAMGLLMGGLPADAQQRWAIEVRGAGAFPTQEIAGDELGNGLGFDATLRYAFLPHLALYGGWDWIHFNPDASFAGPDMDIEETGYVFGLRFERPFGATAPVAGWIRGGGIYDHLEFEDDEGDIIADSDHGLGWEAAAGLAFGSGGSWSVTPGVRYRSLDREVEIGAVTTEVEMRYIAVELGVAWHF